MRYMEMFFRVSHATDGELLSHYNNDRTNAPQCYVIHILPALLLFMNVIFMQWFRTLNLFILINFTFFYQNFFIYSTICALSTGFLRTRRVSNQ